MEQFLWFLAGFVAGGAAAAAVWLFRRAGSAHAGAESAARARMLDEQVAGRDAEIKSLQTRVMEVDGRREEAERRASILDEKLCARQAHFDEQMRMVQDAEKKLADTFAATGARALHANNEQFLALAKQTFEKILVDVKGDVDKKQQAIDALLKPVRELLEKQSAAVTEIEKKRETAYARLDEQIKVIAQSHERLGVETGRLVTALRRPEVRGKWGEVQLRNVVEMAGMASHCDFREQVTVGGVGGEDGLQRPDMVVNLPGGGVIPVDAKVALDGYLSAIQPDADRASEMDRHARHVREHVNRLAAKRYWDQFDRTPGVVVLFIPLESALAAALEMNPDLHADAMSRRVLIATPTLLIALLRAVAYGWQQESVAKNAQKIADAGREVYDRLSKFVEHFEKVGAQLSRASDSYNDAVGSLERNLLPAARRIKAHGATETGQPEIEAPPVIEVEPRRITSPELKSIASDGAG